MTRFLFLIFLTSSVFAKIEDNSFILEEAYNQKPGEFQFIQSYRSYKSGMDYYFISEVKMPLGSEKHQISYQVTRKKEEVDHGSFGDTTFSYRIQSINEPEMLMAHRFDHYPEAKVKFSDKRTTLNEFGIGSSFVYHWKDNWNFLLEATYEANEKHNLNGKKKFENRITLNPGVRTAIDLSWKETQIVPGIAFPIRIEDEEIDHGVFVYLSIEPQF